MLRIYLNSWGNYNEHGADGGAWISLPLDDDDLQAALDALAKKLGDPDPEWFVDDYEWADEIDLGGIPETANLAQLNELAERLQDLTPGEITTLEAVMEYFGGCLDDMEDYLDDLGSYILYDDIHTHEDLGLYWVEDSGCYNIRDLGILAHYIDYEAFGRDVALDADGGFTSYGFIEHT